MLSLFLFILFDFGARNHTSDVTAIKFRNIGWKEAIEIAKKENKHVFIDTYATWCKPCKQMEYVFETPELSQFFNRNFINVKVDMDDLKGKEVAEAFDVVWLPTMIILDPNGQVKNKLDRVIGADELLQIAKDAINPNNSFQERTFEANPFGHSTNAIEEEEELVTEENAPIVYVYDERTSSGRPHIMYHEAYLHLQLMDGKQYEVAKKYLSTQTDWTTDKNVKFIFDFLRTTKSPEFDFFMKNQPLFINLIGEEKVKQNIDILVYQRLHNGFPRPNLEESLRLFSFIEKENITTRAYVYYIDRLASEKKHLELADVAREYLSNINPYDDHVMYLLSKSLTSKSTKSSADLDESLKWAQEAAIYKEESAQIQLQLAYVYYLRGEKNTAKDYCEKALYLAQSQGKETTEIIKLKNALQAL
jgi:thiol-disulfide isomerase/thioredoxin